MQILASFANPEEINDSPQAAPSKRLLNVFRDYEKPLHEILAAKRAPMEAFRDQCPHFNEWLTKLERLGFAS